ncbi:MAG: DUF4091 domain-containing protein [Lentisphaeria bacterium]|nr:DUF4091 domain-containing protein [Lentisphaeria bacterium]
MKTFLSLILFCQYILLCASEGNLLRNAMLQPDQRGGLPHWHALDGKSTFFQESGYIGGGSSIRGKKAPAFAFFQEIKFANPDKQPIIFQGESSGLNAGYGGDYCIYADIFHIDGTVRYAVKAKWTPGTHSWEKALMCHYPEKAVSKIILYVLFRNTTGKALFRNISLRRGTLAPQPSHVSLLGLAPFRPENYRLDLVFFNSSIMIAGKIKDNTETVLAEFKGKGKIFRKEFHLPKVPAKLELDLTEKGKHNRVIYPLSVPTTSADSKGKKKIVVWCANSMEKISPLAKPPRNRKDTGFLEVAGNEHESLQITIANMGSEKLYGVNCYISDLINESGKVFPGQVEFRRITYLPRTIPYSTHPEQLPPHEYWLPDPLLPMKNMTIPARGNSGIWMTVYAPAGTPAGVYKGTVTLTVREKVLKKIEIKLRVFGFDLPRTFSYRSAFSLMDGFLEYYYPKELRKFRRQAWDIMLDHRLNPDDITRTEVPAIEDLLYARSRGMNSFNLLHLVPKPEKKTLWTLWSPLSAYNEKLFSEFASRLDAYIAELEKLDLKKLGYFYGFDERRKDAFDALTRTRDFVKKRWNIPLMSTSTMFQELVRNPENPAYKTTDWYCPLTNFYHADHAEQLRKDGHQVWVYSCCGPEYPYINFANLEYPYMNARQMAWQVYSLKADGFLFWHVNNWHRKKRMFIDDTVNFQRFYQHEKFAMNATGDGEFLYPGKKEIYPSIRLANLRDGSEDYDYLFLLSQKNPDLALEYARKICPNRRNPLRDYRAILKIRREIAEYLEKELSDRKTTERSE